MRETESNEQLLGGLSALGAYFLWGLMPIYWKLINGPSAEEVLANRIFWSFLFMLLVLLFTRKFKLLKTDIIALLSSPKRLMTIIAASLVITVNWFVFIWAVDHGHVVQASLGYYINPLVSVLLGMIFLKERLSMWQMISFVLALIGVLIMTFHTGTFPWISLLLAFSFGFYGLLKKMVKLGAMTGLTIETSVMTPVALIYLLLIDANGIHTFTSNPEMGWLLAGTGVITAIPLLLFAAGANRISLAMVGFFQYIAPTLMLVLGTLVYNEPFNNGDFVAFILIWISLVLFTASRMKVMKNLEAKWLPYKPRSGKS